VALGQVTGNYARVKLLIESNSSALFAFTNLALILTATTAPLGLVVPETSYSSSEGEEDFYDAYDDPFTSLGSSPIGW